MKQSIPFLMIMALATAVCAQTTREVCASCDYTSIQDAVNESERGDIIKILEDTGEGNINVGKELTLIYHLRPFVCGESGIWDTDGNTYSTVLIGNQCWMGENLRVTQYQNGDVIPTDLGSLEWKNTLSGAYAVYDHTMPYAAGIDSQGEMVETYGLLYNWYAVDDPRGLCPKGWHVPSDEDWNQLVNYVASQGFPNSDIPGGAGDALKSCRQVDSSVGDDCNTSEHPRWDSDETMSGLDAFGFSALPGGIRPGIGGFGNLGRNGHWWTATGDDSSLGFDAFYWTMNSFRGKVIRTSNVKVYGLSVRCLRND